MTAVKNLYGSYIICDVCGKEYRRHGVGGHVLGVVEIRTLAREARGWNTSLTSTESETDFCSKQCTIDYPGTYPIDRPEPGDPIAAPWTQAPAPPAPRPTIPRFK